MSTLFQRAVGRRTISQAGRRPARCPVVDLSRLNVARPSDRVTVGLIGIN